MLITLRIKAATFWPSQREFSHSLLFTSVLRGCQVLDALIVLLHFKNKMKENAGRYSR